MRLLDSEFPVQGELKRKERKRRNYSEDLILAKNLWLLAVKMVGRGFSGGRKLDTDGTGEEVSSNSASPHLSCARMSTVKMKKIRQN